MKFEIYQSENNHEYYFRLKAGNGEVVLKSEGYKDKSGCENGVQSVKKNAEDVGRFERKEATNGKHHFNLKAGNGQVIGSSQMYVSKDSMEHGITVVQKATSANVEDLTD
ncbi:MAG: YegP family protein [Chitinophagales bacterium]|nr:YegP family protein [Chitinophagales bacterium]